MRSLMTELQKDDSMDERSVNLILERLLSQEVQDILYKYVGNPEASADEIKNTVVPRLNHQNFFVDEFLTHTPFRRPLIQDGIWYPFQGMPASPETGEDFKPRPTPFVEWEEKQWGRDKQNYSKPFLHQCDLVHDHKNNRYLYAWNWRFGFSQVKSKHSWKEIAIVTNGLCKGTCSFVASR